MAGNRKSDSRISSGGTWTYDWLNRMTHSPSLDGTGPSTWTYTNDILGNRTERNITSNNAGAAKYVWDPLNRMEILFRPSVGASYYYRADGMRVEKVDGATLSWFQISRDSGQYDTNYAQNRATTRYFYDGQMPMEEDYNPSGTVTKVTRNTIGGRGIDMISTTTSSGTEERYPLYDGHGNMIATLEKDSGSYDLDALRTYDVWGSVRSGSATGDPTKRYSANIGHQADDESDLLYMRARYYEPASGRFLAEDPVVQGRNWFVYCGNSPIHRSDFSGKFFVGPYETYQTFFALLRFLVFYLARDAGDVEAAYGRFTEVATYDFWEDTVGLSPEAVNALDLFPPVILIRFFGPVYGCILIYLTYLTRLRDRLPKFYMIMIAHGVRLSAYASEALE